MPRRPSSSAALQYGYGAALDRRDAAALRAVFDPDVVFRVFPPDADEPFAESRGDGQLAMMVEAMADRYAKTMHVMSNPTSTIDGDEATGSVHCVAHHLIVEEDAARTFVVYLRYDDEFRRGRDGEWRIVRRDARFLWTEDGGPVVAWDAARARGRLG